MEILQQFVVNGETFSSLEEAQNYVNTNADLIRISAFIEHLKANGSKRISALVSETVKNFIAFEHAVAVGTTSEASPEGKAEASSTTAGDTFTKEAPVDEGVDEDDALENQTEAAADHAAMLAERADAGGTTVLTGEEQEAKVEEVDETTEVSGLVEVPAEPSGLAGIVPTEKSRNLFAKV